MDGFYAAYLTGRAGNGVVLFAIKDGRLVGVDAGGMKYAGRWEPKANGGALDCTVEYTIPPGMPLIAGSGPVAAPTPVTLKFELPANFSEGVLVRIDTPFGPLNAKFVKLGELQL